MDLCEIFSRIDIFRWMLSNYSNELLWSQFSQVLSAIIINIMGYAITVSSFQVVSMISYPNC
jgi:hypothetical protein